VTQHARHFSSFDEADCYEMLNYRTSRKRMGGGVTEDTEAEASWHERIYRPDGCAPSAPLPSRDRAATVARPLGNDAIGHPGHHQETGDALDTVIIVPAAQHQVVMPSPKKQHSSSRMGRTATSVVRTLLISLLLYYVLSSGLQVVGGPALPLAPFPWASTNGVAAGGAPLRMDGKVVTRVQPMTQMRRVDLYDSRAQFNRWGGSACSAATLAEILTAYGLPHMTIGRMIREMGSDISPQWGLLTYSAFNKVVSRYGLRADVYLSNNPLTYKQMLYLTNSLGVPVVVNMRATTGYYHFLSGGHILVMTGGDSKRIRLTDSSLYHIKSLPLSTYNPHFALWIDQLGESR
jgi:Peptidase_C39 like family